MKTVLQEVAYFLYTVADLKEIDINAVIATFKEKEDTRVVLSKANVEP